MMIFEKSSLKNWRREMDLREKARQLMLQNYELTERKYIPPDKYHIDQYLWDSCFHARACAELDLKDLAKNEIERPLKWRKEDGWIPHQFFASAQKGKPFIDRLAYKIERSLYKKEHRQFHSSITHPAVMAQAVEAINDPEWTKKILPNLLKFYNYFIEKQDPDKDGLISICHPCESGRDTAPDFDFFKPQVKKRGPFNFLNKPLFLFALWRLEWRYKKMGWDIDKIWEKNLFNVEDLMFHCIWVDGLRSLARLIGEDQASEINNLADLAENAVYELCWDEKDKIFYSLDSKHRKIRRKTISNLFPLILDNIPAKMQQGLVEHLTNPEEFWTPYPIPSVSQSDPEFNPDDDSYPNWRGPVWINMNWFILRGLVKHGYQDIAEEIAERTQKMIEREGFREFYNPFTGKGLRERTKGFGWSTLIVTFPKILKQGRKSLNH